jgi:hypothetical protein
MRQEHNYLYSYVPSKTVADRNVQQRVAEIFERVAKSINGLAFNKQEATTTAELKKEEVRKVHYQLSVASNNEALIDQFEDAFTKALKQQGIVKDELEDINGTTIVRYQDRALRAA